MAELELLDPGVRLASQSPTFEIQYEGERVGEAPWGQVDAIFLGPGVGISAGALSAARRLRIPVIWTSADGRPLFWKQEADHRHAELRLAQAIAVQSPARLGFARAILQAKLDCMGAQRDLSRVWDIETLRGIEGDETRSYYQRFFARWPSDWRPPRRSRRPPQDEANALLSFGYSLISGWMLREILVAGLEPSWGFVHEVRREMPGLVQDLIEPFRSAFVDSWALRMVEEGEIRLEMFEQRAKGGVWIKDLASRKSVIRSFLKRMDEPMPGPVVCRARTSRKAMRAVVRRVAAALTQETTPVFPVSGGLTNGNPVG